MKLKFLSEIDGYKFKIDELVKKHQTVMIHNDTKFKVD